MNDENQQENKPDQAAAADSPAKDESAKPAAEAKPADQASNGTEKLQQTIKELEDKLKYAAADKLNTVKRLEKDKQKELQRGVESVIVDFLPIQENLERAYETNTDNVNAFKDGIALILQDFKRLLGQYGIEQINPKEGDSLDVNCHEALVQEEHPSLEANKIVRVVEVGYRHKLGGTERIIRAAKVVVSKQSQQQDAGDKQEKPSPASDN